MNAILMERKSRFFGSLRFFEPTSEAERSGVACLTGKPPQTTDKARLQELLSYCAEKQLKVFFPLNSCSDPETESLLKASGFRLVVACGGIILDLRPIPSPSDSRLVQTPVDSLSLQRQYTRLFYEVFPEEAVDPRDIFADYKGIRSYHYLYFDGNSRRDRLQRLQHLRPVSAAGLWLCPRRSAPAPKTRLRQTYPPAARACDARGGRPGLCEPRDPHHRASRAAIAGSRGDFPTRSVLLVESMSGFHGLLPCHPYYYLTYIVYI
jgi:hypothetical protein